MNNYRKLLRIKLEQAFNLEHSRRADGERNCDQTRGQGRKRPFKIIEEVSPLSEDQLRLLPVANRFSA